MGMYDYVRVKCPKCDNSIEFQSKAGPCNLTGYSVHCVPVAVAWSLNGQSQVCDICGYESVIEVAPLVVDSVNMVVRWIG